MRLFKGASDKHMWLLLLLQMKTKYSKNASTYIKKNVLTNGI